MSALKPKAYALRLPPRMSSRLEALREMHPGKTMSDILRDVLGVGLAQMEARWPDVERACAASGAKGRSPIYLLTGPFSDFRGLALKHHSALARELRQEEPERLHPLDDYLLDTRE